MTLALLIDLIQSAAAVLGIVVGVAAGIFIERRRSRDEDRRRHVSEIRQEVLTPLIQRLESYCLPVCAGNKPVIDLITIHQGPAVGSWEQADDEWHEDFVPLQVTGHSRNMMPEVRDASRGRLNQVLYEHVKESHLPVLFQQYEEAERDLKDWQLRCADYARQTVQELSQTLNIPIVRGVIQSKAGGLFRSLGIFVLERQMGISDRTLRLRKRELFTPWYEAELIEYTSTFAFGTVSQMESCARLVQERLNARDKAVSLKPQGQDLKARFTNLSREMKVAVAKARLPRRCSYV